MSRILLIGEDDFLLETRAAVLRPSGAETVCTNVSSAIPLLEHKIFDLAILCHSIPDHLCQTLSEVIRQNWPSTRVLLVSAVRRWEQDACSEGVEVCAPDPERLIERTVELLGRRKVGSVRSLSTDASERHAPGR
ncbi:MAG TPA: response regulator [Acidobacteriaceae bacterium]|nr:response regulator [Acidobacteriaceae bacterium]